MEHVIEFESESEDDTSDDLSSPDGSSTPRKRKTWMEYRKDFIWKTRLSVIAIKKQAELLQNRSAEGWIVIFFLSFFLFFFPFFFHFPVFRSST